MPDKATLCLTFDNMGSAAAVGKGEQAGRGPADEGPAGYPEVLSMLRDLELQATFFIEGWNALHNPDALLAIAQGGHEVGVHGWIHEVFHKLARVEAERLVVDALAAFRRLGLNPRGFRAPGGVRGPHTTDILRAHGFRYDSSVDSDAAAHGPADAPFPIPRVENALAMIPWRWAEVDFFHYFRAPGGCTPQQLQQRLEGSIRLACERGAVVTVLFHPHASGVDAARLDALRRLLTNARENDRVNFITAGALAERLILRDASHPLVSPPLPLGDQP